MDTKKLMVFQAIADIFAQKGVEGPKECPCADEVKGDERVIGTITDLHARLLFAQGKEFKIQMDAVMEEHMEKHGLFHTPMPECHEFSHRCKALERAAEIGSKLFWEHVESAFPRSASDTGIRKNWDVAVWGEEDPNTNRKILFPDDKSPAMTFFDDVRRALQLTEGDFALEGSNFPVVNETAGEKVIGTITDPRVKALFQVKMSFKGIAETLRAGEGEKDLEKRAVLAGQGNELKSIIAVHKLLFWEGVKENVDPQWEHERIAIRKDWRVVSLPPPEGDFVVIDLSALLGGLRPK